MAEATLFSLVCNVINTEHGHDSGIVKGAQGATHDSDMSDAELLNLTQITEDAMLIANASDVVSDINTPAMDSNNNIASVDRYWNVCEDISDDELVTSSAKAEQSYASNMKR